MIVYRLDFDFLHISVRFRVLCASLVICFNCFITNLEVINIIFMGTHKIVPENNFVHRTEFCMWAQQPILEHPLFHKCSVYRGYSSQYWMREQTQLPFLLC